jgi:aspartyl/asparaginyl beta-hydroxylase (cupin superfamily)
MHPTQQELERLIREGVEALRQGRHAEAQARFGRVTRTGAANAQLWLLLATACRGAGDAKGEEAALDSLLAAEPHAVRGILMKADCRMRAGDEIAAARFYKSGLAAAEGQQLPGDLVAELRRAEAALSGIESRLHSDRETMLANKGLPSGARSPRFQHALDIAAGRKRIYLQEPTVFYFPGLPQVQFFEPQAFDWTAGIEAAAGAIRQELEALLREGADGFRPYIHGNANAPRMDGNRALVDSSDWSALFLCENGNLSELFVHRCPNTWAALQAAPLPRISGWGPTAMFSLLRGGATIAPHTGMFNTRLTCHLPLIVPPGCWFRVGNEVRAWEEGKLMIFDDSIEHEARNESDQDRVVLIFDIWRPELSAQERQELSTLFEQPAA